MRQTLTALLSAAAFSALLSSSPASAQVAGNPGDLHTVTPYIAEQRGYASGYTGNGYHAGLFAPLGALGWGMGAPTTATGGGCSATQDFNGRYTATCAP